MTNTTAINRVTRTTTRCGVAVLALVVVAAACGSDSDADADADGAGIEAPATEAEELTTEESTAPTTEVTTAPTTEVEAPVDASPMNMTSGDLRGECSYDFASGSPFQSCRITSADPSPLPMTFAQGFQVLSPEGTTAPTAGALALVGGSEDGIVFAGTNLNNNARIIAAREGVGEFEGSTVHMWVFSGANAANGGFTMDWSVGDDLDFDPGVDGDSAIIDVVCVIGESGESCTYSGTDDRFVPEPDERTIASVAFADVTEPVDGVSAFTSAAEEGAFRTGLVDENGLRRFTGLSMGTGEFEGSLIAEEGWGRVDGDTFSGSILMSII